jgi:hypothetical protein
VTEYETLERIQTFQGNLKSTDKLRIEKIKTSILKYGFSFPVFIWGLKILDGHQRLTAIKELIEDGHEIDAVPIVRIIAADEKEAAEKLLLINSRYAEITQHGFDEFVEEIQIELPDMESVLHIPEITFFETEDFDHKEHWQGMPEFEQDDITPFKTIKVHFYSQNDMDSFANLVGQKVTEDTRFINYPKIEREDLKNYEYE